MMFGSIVAVIVAGAINVGPISEAFRIAGEGDRLHLFEMSPGEKWGNDHDAGQVKVRVSWD